MTFFTRDVHNDDSQINQIFDAIKHSSLVIFVLTPHFVSHPSSELFLNVTIQMKRESFLLFRKDELTNLTKGHFLSKLIKVYSYYDYCTQNNWSNLEEFLKKHCKSSRNANLEFQNPSFPQEKSLNEPNGDASK